MTTPRPDQPVEARLRQAARSYRLLAAKLRRANPGRRAASQRAEVDLAADGRLLALRVVGSGLVGTQLAKHFIDLSHAASSGTASEGVTLIDLPQDPDRPSPGLGTTRFQLPAGVDRQASPPVMMAQIRESLRRRMATADRAAPRLAALIGEGSAHAKNHAQAQVTVSVNSAGHLDTLTISSWTAELPLEEFNTLLAQALDRATDDLHRQTEAVLDQAAVN